MEWCRILDISSTQLQENFNVEASESIKHPTRYAKNFLEFCCFRTLALSTQVVGHLADKKFRRLTYDMMVAWEAPAASSQPLLNVSSIGLEIVHLWHKVKIFAAFIEEIYPEHASALSNVPVHTCMNHCVCMHPNTDTLRKRILQVIVASVFMRSLLFDFNCCGPNLFCR